MRSAFPRVLDSKAVSSPRAPVEDTASPPSSPFPAITTPMNMVKTMAAPHSADFGKMAALHSADSPNHGMVEVRPAASTSASALVAVDVTPRTPPRSEQRADLCGFVTSGTDKVNTPTSNSEDTPARPMGLRFSPAALASISKHSDERDPALHTTPQEPSSQEPSRLPQRSQPSPDSQIYSTAESQPPARVAAPEPLITYSSQEGFTLVPATAQVLARSQTISSRQLGGTGLFPAPKLTDSYHTHNLST